MSRLGRLSLAFVLSTVPLAASSCGGPDDAPPSATQVDSTRAERLSSLLSTLSADSMEGRRTGTAGAHRAMHFLAAELERYGVEPAGDDGYYQWVPLARVTTQTAEGESRERLVLPSVDLDFDTIAPDRVLNSETNVIGIIRGADPEVAHETVVIGAHYDHVGIGTAVDGPAGPDSIYNGADDDGSGTVDESEPGGE